MYRRLLAGFAGALLLVSCTAVPAASPAPGTAAAQGPSCAKQGGTLVVALPGDIVRTDPALASETNSSYVLQNVLEGLMGFKPGTLKDPVPVLAAEAPTVAAKIWYSWRFLALPTTSGFVRGIHPDGRKSAPESINRRH